MSAFIHQPADKFFKKTMADLRVARQFFESHLPQELLQHADLNTLKLSSRSFIDAKFKASEADVLYQVQLQQKTGYFYLLCEHQSTVDVNLAFRLQGYMMRIIELHLEQHPKSPLPLVYPLVVYTGTQPWHAPRDIFSLFGTEAELAKNYWLKPFQLIEVTQLEDQALQQKFWVGIVEFVFKYQHVRDLAAFLKILFPWLQEMHTHRGTNVAESVLYYVIHGIEAEEKQVLFNALEQLPDQLRGRAMTLAQWLEERGRQEGIQKGSEMKAKELARKLLAQEMSIERVADLVDLPLTTIKELAKTLH